MRLLGFTETPRFTKRVAELLTDEEYGRLQDDLCSEPEAGVIIKGSGGIRKIRWSAGRRGKRGGARVIYYWAVSREKIIMLDIYAKNEKEDLSRAELKELGDLLRSLMEDDQGKF